MLAETERAERALWHAVGDGERFGGDIVSTEFCRDEGGADHAVAIGQGRSEPSNQRLRRPKVVDRRLDTRRATAHDRPQQRHVGAEVGRRLVGQHIDDQLGLLQPPCSQGDDEIDERDRVDAAPCRHSTGHPVDTVDAEAGEDRVGSIGEAGFAQRDLGPQVRRQGHDARAILELVEHERCLARVGGGEVVDHERCGDVPIAQVAIVAADLLGRGVRVLEVS